MCLYHSVALKKKKSIGILRELCRIHIHFSWTCQDEKKQIYGKLIRKSGYNSSDSFQLIINSLIWKTTVCTTKWTKLCGDESVEWSLVLIMFIIRRGAWVVSVFWILWCHSFLSVLLHLRNLCFCSIWRWRQGDPCNHHGFNWVIKTVCLLPSNNAFKMYSEGQRCTWFHPPFWSQGPSVQKNLQEDKWSKYKVSSESNLAAGDMSLPFSWPQFEAQKPDIRRDEVPEFHFTGKKYVG